MNQSLNCYRQINKYFPQVDFETIELDTKEKYQSEQYQTLKVLQQKNLVNPEQISQMLFNRAKEICCDVFYEETQKKLEIKIIPMTSEQLSSIGFESTIAIANLKELFQKSSLEYNNFVKQGGASFSFNYAPFISDKEALQQQVAPNVYQTFVQYFNGKNTLKEIAFKLNQEVTTVALSVIPLLKKKIIKLTQVEDLAPPSAVNQQSSSSHSNNHQVQQAATKTATIVCIDDSPLICNMMNTIVDKLGYKFVGINDPLKAIPVLIQAKPNLIFVDLAMPIINGYELCSQIQKISQLKETPLVMLTGRDFIAERVKAKVIGIADFIGKPIVEEKITMAINKYVQ